ncbi:hypothetical protein [Mesobacterium pallidum]|uniref:hypothetical protein n=1 Tax=Mesobacterium pallidum TaxID=2872037 RepID=UPI001EE38299|nr:hypothetical protein [Mesobacterium pallidum]
MRHLALVLLSIAGPAAAEGARVRFDCLQDHMCAPDQPCPQGGEALDIVLAPQDVAADGSGTFQLTTGGETVPARSAGAFGPFVWGLNGVQHTLIYDGGRGSKPEAFMILHRQPPEGRGQLTRFLCRTE